MRMEAVPLTISELVAAGARRDPDAIALRAPARTPLSYGELHAAVSETGQVLREMGLGADDRVATALPNGPEMAVAFLAVAGATTCAPLNPSYKEGEFTFSLTDLNARALIVERASESPAVLAARRLSVPVIELEPRRDAPAGLFQLRPVPVTRAGVARVPTADDVALVLHTSGTTARPKIVPLTQRNLSVSALNIRRTLALERGDTCLNVMPLFHIHGLVGALLSSVAAGAAVACTAGFRGSEFLHWLRALAATWYTAVPTIHQAALDAVAAETGSIVDGVELRFIRSSSAALPPRVMRQLEASFGVPVIEAYGMTEASHQMASNPIRSGAQRPGSVGLAAGVEIDVINESGRRLGSGDVGEIVIRGETVMRGYEANPEANRAAFADGWFRTGDQGLVDADGYVFLTGRLKELINRGGEKIAPREVEEALLSHPSVAQAVAFSVPHDRLGEEVGAAVVLEKGARTTTAELRRAAEESLSYFKVPRFIEVVSEIPKGATGKVQRLSLAQALGIGTTPAVESPPPRTPLERALAAEWTRLLKRDGIGVEDDFFALGGDSLAATELMISAAQLLEAEVPLVAFLERPTIAGLVEIQRRVRATDRHDLPEGLVCIQAGNGEAPILCAPSGNGSLWRISRFVRRLGSHRPIYGFAAPDVPVRGAPATIEQLAQRNLDLWNRSQLGAPKYLMGSCFGGILALEMARCLERIGKRVERLVMVNSFNPSWRRFHEEESAAHVRAHHLFARAHFLWATLRAFGARDRIEYVRSRGVLFASHCAERAEQLAFDVITHIGLQRPGVLRKVDQASTWAEKRYVPQSYHGPVIMVRADAPIADVYPLPNMGWGGVFGSEVEVIDIACDQLQFWAEARHFEEAADRVAERLGERV